jgi:hypothetical protein
MLPYSEENRAIIAVLGGGGHARRLWVWLALGGISGPLILLGLETAAIMSIPEYDPVRDVMSNLAWSDLGWVHSLGLYISAVMLGALAWGFLRVIRGGLRWRIGASFFFVAAVCFILMGTFHNNHGLTPVTPGHFTHTTSAIVATAVFPIASLLMAGEIQRWQRWTWLYPYTITAAGVGLALSIVVGVGFLPGLTHWPWFGLGERIILINGFAWLGVMAVWSWLFQRRDSLPAVATPSHTA